jgi:hypothetical protein
MEAINGSWLIGYQFTGSVFAMGNILSVRP